MNETVSRAYRYRLLLTPAQEQAVQRQERQLRYAWNRMVNWQRCCMRDWKFGRRTQLLAEMREILNDKNLTGQAAVKANVRAEANGISREEAAALNRKETVAKKHVYGPRRLGVELAQERVMAEAEHFFGGQKSLLYGLVKKFEKSCENWLRLKGCAQAPRYKRNSANVALQRQITSSSRCVLGKESDLSALIGQAGKRCRVAWHRELPDKHAVKQLAIAGRAGSRYLIIFLNCPRQSVLKPFAQSDSKAGIDTGYSCALTVVSNTYVQNRKLRREALDVDMRLNQKLAEDPQSSEGKSLGGALANLERFIFSDNGSQALQPKMARDTKFLKKLRRLQRKMDRQKRSANPECFNSNGTWKKGKRASSITNNLLKTHVQIQKMHEHMADARRDFYHVTAYNLLREHGHIAIGDWRPPQIKKENKPAQKGLAIRRRAMNRKGLDHAISSFESILQDKAALSATPRTVVVVHEAYTTKTCACCKALTGPVGATNIVTWICSACGVENYRKANAAENIMISPTPVGVTAGAQPVAATA